ncbi:TPA: hypothetical protein ACNTUM_000650 [Escherichia coli]|nr:hypothetical protein [Escherichia coli]HCO3884087.1 hypothetical protein [Escherichia coli]
MIDKSGYPGNGEFPEENVRVKITVRDRKIPHEKREGIACWSGKKWVCENGFNIGYAQVIKWQLQ